MEVALFTTAAGVAAFSLAVPLFARLRVRVMAKGASSGAPSESPALLRLARAAPIAWIASRLPSSVDPIAEWMNRRISAAGFQAEGAGRSLLVLLVCFALASTFAIFLSGGGDAPMAALGAGATSIFSPLAWLGRIASRRKFEMERRMPFALDMLALCVEAGSDLAQSMVRLSERLGSGPLAQEFSRVSLALRTGAARGDALALLCHRGNPRSLSRLAKLLVRADRSGSGVGRILRSASSRLGDERFARAERRGAYASQKLLLPLVLCIMPATFVVVFGPLAIRAITGGIGGMLN